MQPQIPFGPSHVRGEIFTGLVRVTTDSLRLTQVQDELGPIAGRLISRIEGATLPVRNFGKIGLSTEARDTDAMPLYPVLATELTQTPELIEGSQTVSPDRRQKMIDHVTGTGALDTDAAESFVNGAITATEQSVPTTLPALRTETRESYTLIHGHTEAHRIPHTNEHVVAATRDWLVVNGEEINTIVSPGVAAATVASNTARIMVTAENPRLAATPKEALFEDARAELIGNRVSGVIFRAYGLQQSANAINTEQMRIDELGPDGFEPNQNVVDRLLYNRLIHSREINTRE